MSYFFFGCIKYKKPDPKSKRQLVDCLKTYSIKYDLSILIGDEIDQPIVFTMIKDQTDYYDEIFLLSKSIQDDTSEELISPFNFYEFNHNETYFNETKARKQCNDIQLFLEKSLHILNAKINLSLFISEGFSNIFELNKIKLFDLKELLILKLKANLYPSFRIDIIN